MAFVGMGSNTSVPVFAEPSMCRREELTDYLDHLHVPDPILGGLRPLQIPATRAQRGNHASCRGSCVGGRLFRNASVSPCDERSSPSWTSAVCWRRPSSFRCVRTRAAPKGIPPSADRGAASSTAVFNMAKQFFRGFLSTVRGHFMDSKFELRKWIAIGHAHITGGQAPPTSFGGSRGRCRKRSSRGR